MGFLVSLVGHHITSLGLTIAFAMSSINLADKLAAFEGHWQPRVVGQFNGHDLMVDNYNVEGWFAVIAPPKLPAEHSRRLHAGFSAAFAAPEVSEAMAKQGNAINLTTPEAATAFFKSELAKYARLVQKSGIKLD